MQKTYYSSHLCLNLTLFRKEFTNKSCLMPNWYIFFVDPSVSNVQQAGFSQFFGWMRPWHSQHQQDPNLLSYFSVLFGFWKVEKYESRKVVDYCSYGKDYMPYVKYYHRSDRNLWRCNDISSVHQWSRPQIWTSKMTFCSCSNHGKLISSHVKHSTHPRHSSLNEPSAMRLPSEMHPRMPPRPGFSTSRMKITGVSLTHTWKTWRGSVTAAGMPFCKSMHCKLKEPTLVQRRTSLTNIVRTSSFPAALWKTNKGYCTSCQNAPNRCHITAFIMLQLALD